MASLELAILFVTAMFGLLSVSASAASQCEPVKVPMCKNMPWNMTRMPNLLHYSTQTNVGLALEDFQALVDTGCSDVLPFYLCAMYAPMCTGDFPEDAVPPCRDVCEAARASCEPVARAHNRSWPQNLACEDLPLYEKAVCVTPSSFVSSLPKDERRHDKSQSVLNKLPDCKCDDRNQKLKWRIYERNHFAYALKATYRAAQGIKGGPLIITIHVDDVLKNSTIRIVRGRDLTLWVGSECECICPLLQEGHQYLILGHEDTRNMRLLYGHSSLAVPWDEKWQTSIKKWERCLTRQEGQTLQGRRRTKTDKQTKKSRRRSCKKRGRKRKNQKRKQKAEPRSNCGSKNCNRRKKVRLKGGKTRREQSHDKLSRRHHRRRHGGKAKLELLEGTTT